MIYTANRSDFIEVLASNKNAIILFYTRNEIESGNFNKIKSQLEEINVNKPELNFYLFLCDEDFESQHFCSVIGIDFTPIIVVYKDGCFSRYKNKEFTLESMRKFIGVKKVTKSSSKVEELAD